MSSVVHVLCAVWMAYQSYHICRIKFSVMSCLHKIYIDDELILLRQLPAFFALHLFCFWMKMTLFLCNLWHVKQENYKKIQNSRCDKSNGRILYLNFADITQIIIMKMVDSIWWKTIRQKKHLIIFIYLTIKTSLQLCLINDLKCSSISSNK